MEVFYTLTLNEKILCIANDFLAFAHYDKEWVENITLEDYLLLRKQALEELQIRSIPTFKSNKYIPQPTRTISEGVERKDDLKNNIVPVRSTEANDNKFQEIQAELSQKKSALEILRNLQEL